MLPPVLDFLFVTYFLKDRLSLIKLFDDFKGERASGFVQWTRES
jgi:hypothetical protein